jgi:tetraacyldisaccharide 4'-kinase
LTALSVLYGQVARFRRSWYDRSPSRRRHLARPVISVGNLVVGGAGKTPVVVALTRLLAGAGHRPAILSRGYARRRTPEGVVVVADGTRVLAGADESGDEPQMLARALPGVPVLVAKDRYLAGRLAESRFDATVLLLDDGFQHLQLARALDLLVVSAGDLQAEVLPSGPLREPLAAARAAHAVLVYGSADEAERIARALGIPAAFSVVPRYGELHEIGRTDAAAPVEGRRVVALAGIARPARFFDALRTRGCEVVREIAYRDHHWFTRADLDRVAAVAHGAGAAAIVTTAKDAVRIERVPRDGRVRWLVLPMDVAIEPAEGFAAWLGQRI